MELPLQFSLPTIVVVVNVAARSSKLWRLNVENALYIKCSGRLQDLVDYIRTAQADSEV